MAAPDHAGLGPQAAAPPGPRFVFSGSGWPEKVGPPKKKNTEDLVAWGQKCDTVVDFELPRGILH